LLAAAVALETGLTLVLQITSVVTAEELTAPQELVGPRQGL
jgi:hypothetical protein